MGPAPACGGRIRTTLPVRTARKRHEDIRDFELPEELRLLKDNLRKFVDRELIPLEREVVNDIKLQKELPGQCADAN